ncbi:AAA family ATPase [Longitalea arenae]|uniref:AAA family ATPase n=1 Tax=Longitalea arenae TaxID=2812558 RepID=UPI001967F551|nr:AAA family ATPase [Longitalea arenae]
MPDNHNLYIVSGGPGSGKTSLLAALAKQGIACMPEAGRSIIQDQLAIGGSALPWSNPAAFADLMLCWDLRSYREAQLLQHPVLFDRGIPDVMGFLLLNKLPVPPHIENAAHTFRYNHRVFLAPPWPDIYTQDAERKQSPEEAMATFNTMQALYTKLNYETILLPLAPVADRVQFLLHSIRTGDDKCAKTT